MMHKEEYLCLWHVLDYSHKMLLGLCIYLFDVIAVILNGWLAYAFLKSRLLTFRSHILLLNLCIASEIKCLVAGFVFSGTSALAGKWIFGISTCQLFAFLRQFIGIFQMMVLTLIAIERYIISIPKRKGTDLSLKFYIIGLGLCWLIAITFSLPPLLGFGSYNCDVSGTTCDLDWRMLTQKQIAFNSILIVFAGIIPVLITFSCLWGANCPIERSIEHRIFDQKSFTKTITVLTTMVLLFWIPQGILGLWIFAQNLHPPRGIPVVLSVMAQICVEAAELIPVLCYLTYDIRIRSGLLEFCVKIERRRHSRKSVRLIPSK